MFLGKNRNVVGCHLHGCGAQDALPFFRKTSQAQAGACKEDDNLLDVDLLWYGASAILNRTHGGAKTILLDPLWNSLGRS